MTPKKRCVAGAVLLAAASACAVGGQDQPRVARDETVPFRLLEPDAPPLLPPSTVLATVPVTLCYVQDDGLALVEVPLEPPVELGALLDALREPPPTPGVRTAVGEASITAGVQLRGGIASIDLTTGVSALGGDDQLFAIAQIVCTLTSRPGVGQVSFTLAGLPVDVPRGDGSLTADPVSRDDYAVLLS
jgi:spore germination protein GerM